MATLLEIYGNPTTIPTIPPDRQSLQGTPGAWGFGPNPTITPHKPAGGFYGWGDNSVAPSIAFDGLDTYSNIGSGLDVLNGPNGIHF
jgi:hypothetical protein